MVYIITNDQRKRMQSERRCEKIFQANEKYTESQRKEYKPSQWHKEMVSQIKKDTDRNGNYKPSTSFIDSLKSKGGGGKVPEHAKAELKEKGYAV